MKKTFLLTDGKKDPQRILESIKHDIRKYIKREKRKPLPQGSNFWKINCKFGPNKESAVEIRFEDVMKNINKASEQNMDSIYIELIAEAGTMNFKKKQTTEAEDSEIHEDDIELEN
ncbi:MAG: DUF6172 family protein [Campylobacterota bacterium]|nr:DUF6172 family protein [Campylobacterota bacterium]